MRDFLYLNTMKKFAFILSLVFCFSIINAQENQIEFKNLKEALKTPEKVFRLNLSNQSVNLPDSIWSTFVNLEYLSLKDDHLIEFPKGITRLKKLKTLDLSGNDFKEIPIQFLELSNLEELYLNDQKNLNYKLTLPTLSKLPKLKSLHLENDNLTLLPKELSTFQRLESLYLNGNKFTKFPQELEDLEKLKYIEIYDNPLILNEYKPNGNMVIKF